MGLIARALPLSLYVQTIYPLLRSPYNRFARIRIENEQIVADRLGEIKQRADRVCNSVKRALPNALSIEPIVLDKSNHRGLIGNRVIDEIVLGPW
jgi:hypothetical protein